eukprot:scaffold2036_cov256-Pinguiococcus_pyrenoidosus.AAC.16
MAVGEFGFGPVRPGDQWEAEGWRITGWDTWVGRFDVTPKVATWPHALRPHASPSSTATVPGSFSHCGKFKLQVFEAANPLAAWGNDNSAALLFRRV